MGENPARGEEGWGTTEPERDPMFNTILLPLDGSDLSEKAIPLAVDLAKRYQSQLWLMRAMWPLEVWPPDIYVLDDQAYTRVTDLDLKNCVKYLDKKVAELQALGVEKVGALAPVHTRLPEEWICQQATDHHADVIVMSFHGRSGMNRFFHGSVAEHVARQAQCPVLLVPVHETKPG